ncbi:MAG: hypothetical protein M1832_004317 [Thelocarpon impressellum]|nr:MAG: hypothetical protein M1832_004317 [Thelocarpon impressellum]
MASTSVNRPTNVKQKDEDINQKLQLYGIFTAFSLGKVPSNKQIDVALNSLLASRQLASPSDKLSPEGKRLIADARTVIEQAKHLALSKNDGNLLQDFIWHSSQIGGGNAQLPGAPVDKQTAQQHGNQALDGLRTLGTLLISNGQFRKLLSDATILIRDMAGDAAQNAAGRVNPSQDRLAQIDRPADDNTWHEVPDLSRDNLRNQAKGQFNKQKPFDQNDVKAAAGDATQASHPGDSRDPADAAALAAQDQQRGTASGVDASAGVSAAANTLRDKAAQNVPDDTKDRARDTANKTRDQTKNYLSNKMPQERREQIIWRLKKMVVEIQGHQDYQQAIETLLNLAEQYTGHAGNVAEQSKGTVKGVHEDSHLRAAETDLRTLIERFANSTSADDLLDSVNAIYRDADRDPELKGWFRNINAFVRRSLKEEGYVMQDDATREWNKIYDQGQFLFRDRYRNHTDRVVDELRFLADQFDKDPQNRAFADSMQKLFNDLGNDQNGKPTFKPHLVKDLTNVILPELFESVRYVPIPRIEYSDHMIDAVVENLVIESDNLMPNVFEFGSDNYFRFGRKQIASKASHKTMLSVSGVQMDLRDVSYYVKKKSGFPAITDLGVADIFMGGQGFSFKAKMATADAKDRQHFFKLDTVVVDVKHLNIKLKQSKHKTLFNIFKPLLFRVLRPAIQKVLEKQIKDYVTQADAYAWAIHQEAQKAASEVARDPENAPNVYNRYFSAAQKRFMQGKKKSQEVAADKKVNVAVTAHDSIFPDVKLPGGISTKATEYKDLATRGERWESPVFSIGLAKESTNVPKVAPVQRKGHQTTEATIRGPNNLESGTNANGFGSQVDQSFGQQQDLSLGSGANKGAAPVSGHTNGNGPQQTGNGTVDGTYNEKTGANNGTTLGASNPVLTGAAH